MPRGMNNEFRSTLWFKKGALDAEAREEATGQSDGLHPGAADLLPPEDRYKDDGSINAADADAYSLRTGHTQAISWQSRAAAVVAVGNGDVWVTELRAARRRRAAIIVVIAISLAAAAVALASV